MIYRTSRWPLEPTRTTQLCFWTYLGSVFTIRVSLPVNGEGSEQNRQRLPLYLFPPHVLYTWLSMVMFVCNFSPHFCYSHEYDRRPHFILILAHASIVGSLAVYPSQNTPIIPWTISILTTWTSRASSLPPALWPYLARFLQYSPVGKWTSPVCPASFPPHALILSRLSYMFVPCIQTK